MESSVVVIVSLICVTLLIIAVLFIGSRAKLAQERTLQRMMESNEEVDPRLLEMAGLAANQGVDQDFRRGVIFVVSGATLGIVFYQMGGSAWKFSFLPMVIGAVYIFFWALQARKS